MGTLVDGRELPLYLISTGRKKESRDVTETPHHGVFEINTGVATTTLLTYVSCYC